MDYHAVSGFAQSWGLVYLVVLFVVVIGWALWPRNRAKFDEAARIPFKED
jgi:cytochrome c oxidase cbb3-type subunit IV